MRKNRRSGGFFLGWVAIALCVGGPCRAISGTYTDLLQDGPIVLKHGDSVPFRFHVEDPTGPVLIGFRAVVVRPAGTVLPEEPSQTGLAGLMGGAGGLGGGHCLEIALNGMPLTEAKANVLNKREIVDATGPVGRAGTQGTRIPLFRDGKWFLKAYEQDVANQRIRDGIDSVTDARRSHYEEYLFKPGDLRVGENMLTFSVDMPDALRAGRVRIEAIGKVAPSDGILVTRQDWMMAMFPWQAPAIETTAARLDVSGCRGEFVPLAFNVYGLEAIPEITITVSDLVHAADDGFRIPSASLEAFRVMTLERSSLGEAGFIARMPFVPEAWRNHSPELLVPVADSRAHALPFHRTEREQRIAREAAEIEEAVEEADAERAAMLREGVSGIDGFSHPGGMDLNFLDEPPEEETESRTGDPENEAEIPLPTLAAFHSQPFLIDTPIPDEAPTGVYRGEIRVVSAGKVVRSVPLRLEVLPFDLVEARQKYYMWQLTWMPPWDPRNVERLRDIQAHGYTGMVRTAGTGFKFKRGRDGRIEVLGEGYRRYAEVLREVGLEVSTRDTHVGGRVVSMVLAPLVEARLEELRTRLNATMPDISREAAVPAPGVDDVLGEFGEEFLNEPGKGTKDDPEALREEMAKLNRVRNAFSEHVADIPEDLREAARPEILRVFREVKAQVEDMGLDFYVFPIDEPCGTPWRREFTRYVAGLARDAGLKTFSTRNNYSWDANIDFGAAGGMINARYRPAPGIVEKSYSGDLDFPALPMIGAFRSGPKYHFDGLIEDVRIYDRALSDEEILAQHESPASDGLLAHYDFQRIENGIVQDASGGGNHARLVNAPSVAPGRKGRAIQLQKQREQRLEPLQQVPVSERGWTISLWYKGEGCLFGNGYDFRHEPARIRFVTAPGERNIFPFRTEQHAGMWAHLTLVFDPAEQTVKGYVFDEEIRRWYRENIEWNYIQIRSMPPKNPRYKTGIMSWYYGNLGRLRNITTFCYDWNFSHLYVVYPKDANRFNREGIWYGTLGWTGTREGIDDARYLQTLVQVLREKSGMTEKAAIEKVIEIIAPVGVGYEINKVIEHFGGYDRWRRRIVEEILQRL